MHVFCISAKKNKTTFANPKHHMSHVMRKPDFCICENKGADQLCGNRTTDQRLCFRYTDSTITLLSKFEFFKPLAIFCGSTARFVWDLVGNPEDRFSHNEAHIILVFSGTCTYSILVVCISIPMCLKPKPKKPSKAEVRDNFAKLTIENLCCECKQVPTS